MNVDENIWRDKAFECLRCLKQANDNAERFDARLAKVPALVEALLIAASLDGEAEWEGRIRTVARDALAVWDAEHPGLDTTP